MFDEGRELSITALVGRLMQLITDDQQEVLYVVYKRSDIERMKRRTKTTLGAFKVSIRVRRRKNNLLGNARAGGLGRLGND